jgi:uncharacterized protein (UPF0335 family)
MTDDTDDLGGNSATQLAGFIERIEAAETEMMQGREKRKAEYAQAEAIGLDKAVIRQMVKDRRADVQKTIEFRAKLAAYRKALANLTGRSLGDLGEWARTWRATEAKMSIDETEADQVRPLDELLKGRKGKGKDDGTEGKSDEAP